MHKLRGPRRPEAQASSSRHREKSAVDYGSGPMVRDPQSLSPDTAVRTYARLQPRRCAADLAVECTHLAELHESVSPLRWCPCRSRQLEEGVAVPDIYDPTIIRVRDVLAHTVS